MSDAPKRVWLDWPAANRGDVVYDEPPERDTQPGQTEYVRADLVNDAMRAGYELAAAKAREMGVWLRRFDLAVKDKGEG